MRRSGQRRSDRPDVAGQPAEKDIEDELIEGSVPTSSPKFCERSRLDRCVHDRSGVQTSHAPGDPGQIEQSEMENENEARHSNPAGQSRIWDKASEEEEEAGAKCDLKKSESNFRNWSALFLGRRGWIEESERIHARPEKQIGQSASERNAGKLGAGAPKGQPFATQENRSGHEPHENPGLDLCAHSQGEGRENEERNRTGPQLGLWDGAFESEQPRCAATQR